MRMRLYWPVVIAATALVGLLAYGVAAKQTDTSIDQAVASGERIDAPEATLPLLDASGNGSLADRRGKVVVLNFWASWCGPCVKELPLLERTQEKIRDQGGMVLGVDYKDVRENAQEFVTRFNLSYPHLRDRDGAYAEKYDSRAFPETFVIDRQGKIAAVRRGPVTREWLDATLPPLLEEKT
jgi:cytochrome c biogenesis protein CcmG, thiol:disulfide interchange protein DsbE